MNPDAMNLRGSNPQRHRSILLGNGIFLLLLGVGGLVLPIAGSPLLNTIWSGGLLMVFNTALCFCVAGVGFFALSLNWRPVALGCSTLVALTAAAILFEYGSGHSLGIDQFFRQQPFPRDMPGRMGLNTALAFVLTSVAMLFMVLKPSRTHHVIPAIAGGILGLCIIAFLGFFAGLRPSLSQSYFTMTLSAAGGFAVTAAVLLIWIRLQSPHRNAVVPVGAIGIVMLISLGVISVLSSESFDSANHWVRHTYMVREALNRITLDLVNSENVARLYESTSERHHVASFHDIVGEMRRHASDLTQLVADNPLQTERAGRLQELVDERIKFLERRLTDHEGRTFEEIDQTQLLTARVQTAVDEMSAEEERLLKMRSEKTDLASRQIRRLSTSGGLVAVGLLALTIALLEYAEKRRERAERELVETNKELSEASSAAQESTRLKARFLANMSHEIRTPMNGVVGMIELLLDTRLSSDQRGMAETVRASANTLLAVLNDILDFSKIEAGQLIFNKAPFDLREPIENCLGLLAKQAHAKGLELAYLLEEDVPTQLVGDSNRLGQVLLNLVGNAVKFTPRGEVILKITKDADADRAVVLRFSIRDTGMGISAQDQKKLFQAFVQADDPRSRNLGGTGLGLAICQQLVQLMEGEIDLESRVGSGSTFWFTARFPLQDATPKVVLPQNDLAGMRGLIVDDNATNREILTRQLASWLIESETASDGEQAIARMKTKQDAGTPFHFAILDMNMPGLSGLDLAKAVRSNPSMNEIKLLLLTSMGQILTDEELCRAGIDALLIKPARHTQLYEKLSRFVVGNQNPPSARIHFAASSDPTKSGPDVKLHILVAEDNPINQHVIRLQLERFGYQPVLVGNGVQAIETIHAQKFDVIFMDCQMPELDGIETTRQIRAEENDRRLRGESFAPLHIIAMTANAMVGDREACLAAGMDDYLSKPVKPAAIVEALARVSASRV